MLANRRDRRARDAIDNRQRWSIMSQVAEKQIQLMRLAFELDHHAVRIVSHPSAKTKPRRHRMSPGTKSHALHDPADFDSNPGA